MWRIQESHRCGGYKRAIDVDDTKKRVRDMEDTRTIDVEDTRVIYLEDTKKRVIDMEDTRKGT